MKSGGEIKARLCKSGVRATLPNIEFEGKGDVAHRAFFCRRAFISPTPDSYSPEDMLEKRILRCRFQAHLDTCVGQQLRTGARLWCYSLLPRSQLQISIGSEGVILPTHSTCATRRRGSVGHVYMPTTPNGSAILLRFLAFPK